MNAFCFFVDFTEHPNFVGIGVAGVVAALVFFLQTKYKYRNAPVDRARKLMCL